MLKTFAPGPKLTSAPLRMRVSTCPASISEVIVGLVAMMLFNNKDWKFCGNDKRGKD